MSNLTKSEQYSDGNYKVIKISNGKFETNRITCENEGICILPFDTSNGKVNSVYLARYTDFISNDESFTCINSNSNDLDFSTQYENIEHIVKSELGINPEIDDLYYLGPISHNIPFSKSYKCYGLNLDNYSEDLSGFKVNLTESEADSLNYALTRVKFSRILKGDVDDSLCLSASLLLVSYLD